MKESPFTDYIYILWWLVLQMRHTMYRVRSKELSQYGITLEESGVLFAIQSIGNRATPAKISRFTFRQAHSVSELLGRMEQENLIKRTKNLKRKNLVRVVITKKGRQAYNQATKRGVIHKIMSCLSEGEQHQLGMYLQKLWYKAIEELPPVRKPSFPPSQPATSSEYPNNRSEPSEQVRSPSFSD